jgi:hypothetical protein
LQNYPRTQLFPRNGYKVVSLFGYVAANLEREAFGLASADTGLHTGEAETKPSN